ncbi:Putative UDP-glucuronosyltransferase ugt-50 [Toxocara canis]|uniref:glucuronosyltransferase n=1 Tax=Toxocara canis TaxID=6265 RepID=A0A0B2ULG0_TOXCA|nr:Putative UDP-glucuronosyltransferase ugt-50 [Toxocara canis]
MTELLSRITQNRLQVMLIPEYKRTNFDGAKLAKVIHLSIDSDDYANLLADYSSDVFQRQTLGIMGRVRWQRTMASLCESVLQHKEELERLQSLNFQIGFSGTIDYCGMGLIRHLGIPNHIWVSDTALNEAVAFLLGIPQPLSYVPIVEENDAGTDMKFMERVHNFYMWETSYFIHVYGGFLVTLLFRKYGNTNFPNVRDVAVDSALCLINSDEFLDFARPVLHKTVYIGGLSNENNVSLPKHFASSIEKGKQGIVIVSFGAFMCSSSMPSNIRTDLFKVFAGFSDYHFLINIDKLDEESAKMAKYIPNVEVFEWTPQSNILGHPHVKLFITSGGINDILDATMHAVPILTIPLFRDEFRNAKMVESRGIGLSIPKQQLNYEYLKSTLKEMLDNQRFSKAAAHFSALMLNKPNKPREQLIKWTEFVAQFGSLPELRPYGGSYRTFKYFILDVIITSLLFILLSLLSKMLIVRLLWRLSRRLRFGDDDQKKTD